MDPYFQALSFYRRRAYDVCINLCTELLQKNISHVGLWELKIRAMTQRVYVDDIETEDGVLEEYEEDLENTRLATEPRPGTTFRATAVESVQQRVSTSRPKTSNGRYLTGTARPGTLSQRATSSITNRTATALRSGIRSGIRTSSSRNIRLGSATMFSFGDPTSNLFDVSKLNFNKFVNKPVAKSLFIFLYYHECDIRKALEFCKVIIDHQQNAKSWWWNTQTGRCYLALRSPRSGEKFLRTSFAIFPCTETALLLARVYAQIDQPLAAIDVLNMALQKYPDEIGLLTQQGRILELLGNIQASVRIYRHIAQHEPVNSEALSNIAIHHFYGNQPEMALLYYRRILSMGAHSCELYCNMGICCLYGGHLDLVLPCFQRAIFLAIEPNQKSGVWYNLSFVALTVGDINLARRCLRLCLSLDVFCGSALNNLGVIAIQMKQLNKAKSYLAAAKTVLPDSYEGQCPAAYFTYIVDLGSDSAIIGSGYWNSRPRLGPSLPTVKEFNGFSAIFVFQSWNSKIIHPIHNHFDFGAIHSINIPATNSKFIPTLSQAQEFQLGK